MRWAYHVKEKVKAASLLVVILGVLLVSHFVVRKNFTDLDHSVASIYQDRLVPATYIFDITNHLYEKRLLHEQYVHAPNLDLSVQNTEHDQAIAAIVKNYESTYLTVKEKKEWQTFKQHLLRYQQMNELELAAVNNNIPVTAGTQRQHVQAFHATLQSLNVLSKIQIGEGSHIQAQSKAIIGGSVIMSYLEISMLIVLGGFTLVLLSVSDKAIFNLTKKASLN